MSNDRWDPDTYARFSELRSRPFWDLVDSIDTSTSIRSLVDLGCGAGGLTAELAERLDVETALGVDNSKAMLDAASEHAHTRCRFEHGDIGSWTSDRPVDLLIANASLQWVPDHDDVLRRWVGCVAVGGQIGVQMPANGDHPSHTCSAAVAAREPFASAMNGSPPPDPVVANVANPEQYAELLYTLGIAEPRVWMNVYPQVMESTSAVVEWTRGTSLTRFFRVLPDDLHEPFVDAYRRELVATVGDRSPYLYTFKRIFLVGRRTT